jgi:hypothetical protein
VSRERLGLPPSGITGELGGWLNQVWRAVNQIPTASYFSGANPNTSGFTGGPGDLLVNVGSASTNSRLWIMGGASVSTNSWVVVRVA